LLSKADIQLLLSLRGSFRTRKELDSVNPVHRDTLSKSLRNMEEMGFILKTPREVDGRYTAEFNLTRKGRELIVLLDALDLPDLPETGLTSQRLSIIRSCVEGKRFGEITEELGIAEPNVDRHLKILVGAGLLEKGEDAYHATAAGRELVSLIGEADR